MPLATVKRPGLLADVFFCQQGESQRNNWPVFYCPLHVSRVVEFEAHKARLGGRLTGSDIVTNISTVTASVNVMAEDRHSTTGVFLGIGSPFYQPNETGGGSRAEDYEKIIHW